MIIALFEDERYNNFLPITYTRAVFDIRIGLYTFLERARKHLGKIDSIYTRSYLSEIYKEERGIDANVDYQDEGILLVNSRVLLTERFAQLLKTKAEKLSEYIIVKEDTIVAIKTRGEIASKLLTYLVKEDYDHFNEQAYKISNKLSMNKIALFNYPWQIIHHNSDTIKADFKELRGKPWQSEPDPRCVIYGNHKDIYIGRNTVIEAYVVLDATQGPIYIDDDVKICSGTRIEGPTYIGKGTKIMSNSLIREGSNIGPICRIGGEIEESIIHGYTNKYHTGFIGHSYIGEWVNLGALTTNSDLKNTYGTVRLNLNGSRIDTNNRKIGCFIGDMTKTSIGTLIYTGKTIGISSHLHGVVYEDVPSFTIYAKTLGLDPVELRLESAIETQRRMMARRGLNLTRTRERLIRYLYTLTQAERKRKNVIKSILKFPE